MSGHGYSRNARFKICDRKCIFHEYLMTSPATLAENADISKNNRATMIFFYLNPNHLNQFIYVPRHLPLLIV